MGSQAGSVATARMWVYADGYGENAKFQEWSSAYWLRVEGELAWFETELVRHSYTTAWLRVHEICMTG
jgi:hypothetical protein